MRPLILAGLFGLATAPALGAQVSCDGPFAPDSSEEALVAAYGRANVVTGMVPGPEGSEVLATTVFPDDPQRRFEVGWWDKDARAGLAYATIPPADTAPGGVRLGMSLDEVEGLNGEPFQLQGFGWDYGGVAWFDAGNLSAIEGGCHLSLTFSESRQLPEGMDAGPITGDQVISSDEPLLVEVAPTVTEMSIGYPNYGAIED
jgi:hypothetical protein